MDHKSYRDQVKDLVGEVKAAAEEGKFTTREILGISAAVLDAGMHVLAAVEKPNDHLEELIRDCETLFDEYVAPVDLPGVPNAIEPVAKLIARQSIRPALTAAIDALRKAA